MKKAAAFQQTVIWGAVCVILYCFIAVFYIPSVSFSPISLDDHSQLQTLTGQPISIIWKFDRFGHLRPVKSLFFWGVANNRENLAGYRILILSVFLLSLALVQFLTTRISGSRWTGGAAAMCWALNPATFTVISWLSAATNTFSLLAVLAYLSCGYNVLTIKSGPGRSTLWLILSVFFLILALLSHELALGAPIVLLAAQRFFNWGAFNKKAWLFYSASGVCITAFSGLYVLNGSAPAVYRFKDTPAWLISFSAARYLLHNTSLWIWPLNRFGVLLADEPGEHLLASALCWVIVFMILLAVLRYCKHDRIIMIGFFWYLLFWLPQSNIIPLGNTPIAIHYMFFPSIGLSIVLCRLAVYCIENVAGYDKRLARVFAVVLSGVVLMAWLPESRRVLGAWSSAERLYGMTHRNYPNAVEPMVNLSDVYARRGQYEKAIFLLEKARRTDPENITIIRHTYGLFWETGRFSDALSLLDEYPLLLRQPEFMVRRGEALEQLKRYSEAAEMYGTAFERLTLSMDNAFRYIAGYRLVVVYLYTNQRDRARALVKRLVKDYPDRKELLSAYTLLMESQPANN